jgi:hypothetical protein
MHASLLIFKIFGISVASWNQSQTIITNIKIVIEKLYKHLSGQKKKKQKNMLYKYVFENSHCPVLNGWQILSIYTIKFQ